MSQHDCQREELKNTVKAKVPALCINPSYLFNYYTVALWIKVTSRWTRPTRRTRSCPTHVRVVAESREPVAAGAVRTDRARAWPGSTASCTYNRACARTAQRLLKACSCSTRREVDPTTRIWSLGCGESATARALTGGLHKERGHPEQTARLASAGLRDKLT